MIGLNFATWLNELFELPQVDSDKSCQSVCPTATVVWLIELIDNWRNLALKDQEGIEDPPGGVQGMNFLITHRGDGGDGHRPAGVARLARYCARWDRPRPEAYREDVAAAVEAGLLSPADAAAGTFLEGGGGGGHGGGGGGLATDVGQSC